MVHVCCVVMVDVVFFLYLFPRVGWGFGVHACWCGGPFFAGGDGLWYPNRFCRLGCRFVVQKVGSFGVLRVLYKALCASWSALIVASVVCFTTLVIVEGCSNLY